VNPSRWIAVDFTDRELAAYASALDSAAVGGADWPFWAMAALGLLAGLGGRFAALATGVVTPAGANLVVALVVAGFFLGLWSPPLWLAGLRRRVLRAQAQPTALLIAERGLFVRRGAARSFYPPRAIVGVVAERGLALIRLRGDRPIALPVRLLDDAAWTRLRALAPADASAPPQ